MYLFVLFLFVCLFCFGRYTTSIDVWRGIFRAISFAGVVMTGLVMAITSDMLPKLTYQAENGNLDGFINATLWYDMPHSCWVRTFWVTGALLSS